MHHLTYGPVLPCQDSFLFFPSLSFGKIIVERFQSMLEIQAGIRSRLCPVRVLLYWIGMLVVGSFLLADIQVHLILAIKDVQGLEVAPCCQDTREGNKG